MLNLMTLDMFAPYENQTYSVDPGNGEPVELKLIRARGKDLHTTDGRYGRTIEESKGVRVDPFSLLFAGPADRFLPQRTYAFTHEAIGEFIMMIVPVGLDERGYLYEAIFA
jgi:hypothetical protein